MNEQTATQIGSFARLGLGLLSGYLVSRGKIDPAAAETLVGGVLAVGTGAWAWMKNRTS